MLARRAIVRGQTVPAEQGNAFLISHPITSTTMGLPIMYIAFPRVLYEKRNPKHVPKPRRHLATSFMDVACARHAPCLQVGPRSERGLHDRAAMRYMAHRTLDPSILPRALVRMCSRSMWGALTSRNL